jgi:hypothetical protein
MVLSKERESAMKTKDVRTLPPELRELAKLALSFKNKYRKDSDIAIVRMVLALYDGAKPKVQGMTCELGVKCHAT